MKSLSRDLSVSLSQYAALQYQTPLLLMDSDAFNNLIDKKRYFVTAPIHSDIEVNKNLVIAPFSAKGNQTLAIDYGSVFIVLDVLKNYEDEIEGLEPGYMIVTVESLFPLDEATISYTRPQTLH
ncbi:hypothetical protein [Nitrosomonas sp. Nm166]|uniref:hypothetical protein n=1 Tax=Nitrosomonas sp. Nm166 TaxID=1881054 RepID=UPI0008F191C8|nr:hypothetical protein [Nitrosomonas sp. Nm166]SFF04715.1 hypothetical protein SAMN05428977_104510 [Nitrosomonas sp. Nm166]